MRFKRQTIFLQTVNKEKTMHTAHDIFLKNFTVPAEYMNLFEEVYLQKNQNKKAELDSLHKEIMKKRLQAVESVLETMLLDEEIPARLSEAMRYSLMAGGKRLRPILCLSMAKLCSASCKEENAWLYAIPFAAALEMIHTYSLIHDDLPAMDNDDLRRGKPTCHKAFDEATAILAGDGLLTDAFYYMADCPLPSQNVLPSLQLIAKAVGSQGMVGGQMLDMEAERRKLNLEELCILNAKKTGALIQCACLSGASLMGASTNTKEYIKEYGTNIGIAFQIIDDVLDIVGDSKLLGKNTGSDEANQKSTWPSLIGIEESKKKAAQYCQDAVKNIQDLAEKEHFLNKGEQYFLQKTAHDMAYRVY